MKKYKIIIQETVSQDFDIEAEDEKAALRAAIEKYQIGDIVLEPGEVQTRQIAVTNPEGDICFCEF